MILLKCIRVTQGFWRLYDEDGKECGRITKAAKSINPDKVTRYVIRIDGVYFRIKDGQPVRKNGYSTALADTWANALLLAGAAAQVMQRP